MTPTDIAPVEGQLRLGTERAKAADPLCGLLDDSGIVRVQPAGQGPAGHGLGEADCLGHRMPSVSREREGASGYSGLLPRHSFKSGRVLVGAGL